MLLLLLLNVIAFANSSVKLKNFVRIIVIVLKNRSEADLGLLQHLTSSTL